MTAQRALARRTHRSRPLRAVAGPALAVVLAATLVGCSSDSDDDAATPTTAGEQEASSTGTDAEDAPAADDVCAEFEAAGGTGATVGPLQLWLPKEDLAAEIDGKLSAMGDIEPPADVAEAWNASTTYYEELAAAVDALPAGGTITDPETYGTSEEMSDTFSQVTDWYFATCR